MSNTHRLKGTRRLLDCIRAAPLVAADLCYPMYVAESPRPEDVMLDVPYFTLDTCLLRCEELCRLGVPAVMIFDVVDDKDETGTRALRPEGFPARLFEALRREFRDELVTISNAGLCSYRRDGSCVHIDVDGRPRWRETAEHVARIALAHARYGAGVIGLPEMVDGQVAATRAALDAAGLDHVPTLSMVKGDSCLFNPFARAVKGAAAAHAVVPSYRHRSDPSNAALFLRKVAIEVEEGVDILAIKPAAHYLDLLSAVRQRHAVPLAAFQVSGEYLMLKLAARSGFFGEEELFGEAAACFKRAGADLIITYQAVVLARALARAGGRAA